MSLEENYMNCMLQKALRDKVLTNRCVMDSILWFHLECPKAASKFDNPVEFKRKWRNFLADTKTSIEVVTYQTDTTKRMKEEYGFVRYPEDIKDHSELRQFQETFRQYSPVTKPEPAEEYLNEEELPQIDIKNSEYGKRPDFTKTKPLKLSDSQRFSQ